MKQPTSSDKKPQNKKPKNHENACDTDYHEDLGNSTLLKKGDRIRYVREKLTGLSREEFCENVSISLYALKSWELGWKNGPNKSKMKTLISYLRELGINCSAEWIVDGTGTPPINFNNSDLEQISFKEVEVIGADIVRFKEINPGGIVTLVKDDAMIPFAHIGDYVCAVVQNDIRKAINHACVLVDFNGNNYIRILRKSHGQNLFNLVSYNKKSMLPQKIVGVRVKEAAIITRVIITRKGII